MSITVDLDKLFDEETELDWDCLWNVEAAERFLILGQSDQLKLLVVCHCYRESDTVIRLISARKATRDETVQYYDF